MDMVALFGNCPNGSIREWNIMTLMAIETMRNYEINDKQMDQIQFNLLGFQKISQLPKTKRIFEIPPTLYHTEPIQFDASQNFKKDNFWIRGYNLAWK